MPYYISLMLLMFFLARFLFSLSLVFALHILDVYWYRHVDILTYHAQFHAAKLYYTDITH